MRGKEILALAILAIFVSGVPAFGADTAAPTEPTRQMPKDPAPSAKEEEKEVKKANKKIIREAKKEQKKSNDDIKANATKEKTPTSEVE